MRLSFTILPAVILIACATSSGDAPGYWSAERTAEFVEESRALSDAELLARAEALRAGRPSSDSAYYAYAYALRLIETGDAAQAEEAIMWLRRASIAPLLARRRQLEPDPNGAMVYRYSIERLDGLPEAAEALHEFYSEITARAS